MAAAAQEAATAQVRGEVAAAAQEARLAQEAIVCKLPEVKALEEALAQERAKKEAGERVHAEATAKRTAPGRTPSRPRDGRSLRRGPRQRRSRRRWKQRRLGCSRPGKPRLLTPGRRPKGELPQPRPPQWRRRRPSSSARLPQEDPEWRKLFEGDASSKMTPDLEEVNTGSIGDSGPTAYRQRKSKGKTPERSQRPAGGHPHDSDPFFTASDGDGRGRRHRRGMAGGGGGDVSMEREGESEDLPPPYRSSGSTECETETPRWGNLDEEEHIDFGYTEKPPSSDSPR